MQAARLRSWRLLHRNRPCNFDNGLGILNSNTQILREALSLSHLISYSPKNHGHRFLGRKNAEGFVNMKSPSAASPLPRIPLLWRWLDEAGDGGLRLRLICKCPEVFGRIHVVAMTIEGKSGTVHPQVSTCGREGKVRKAVPSCWMFKEMIISRWERFYKFSLFKGR